MSLQLPLRPQIFQTLKTGFNPLTFREEKAERVFYLVGSCVFISAPCPARPFHRRMSDGIRACLLHAFACLWVETQ